MPEQVWTAKKAQDLRAGDLIGSHYGKFALEVISVKVVGEKVEVQHYQDLYRQYTKTYVMWLDQPVPVAISGVSHMDFITNYFLTKPETDEKGKS